MSSTSPVAIGESATRVAALLAGDVDFIAPVPATALTRLEHAPGIDLVTMPGVRITLLQLNQRRVPAFRDRRVRLAMNYAVDQRAIAKHLLEGSSPRRRRCHLKDMPGTTNSSPHVTIWPRPDG